MRTFLIMAAVAIVSSLATYTVVASAAQPDRDTVADIIQADNGLFDVLAAALVKTELMGELDGKQQYTVFAPLDKAFVALFDVADEAEALVVIENYDEVELTNLLLNHVTHGERKSQSLKNSKHYHMLNGNLVPSEQIEAAGMAAKDKQASNGMVHVMDDILLPE